jgi:hypothetical protein
MTKKDVFYELVERRFGDVSLFVAQLPINLSGQKNLPVLTRVPYSPCFSKNEAICRRFEPSSRNSWLFFRIVRIRRVPLGYQSNVEKIERLD